MRRGSGDRPPWQNRREQELEYGYNTDMNTLVLRRLIRLFTLALLLTACSDTQQSAIGPPTAMATLPVALATTSTAAVPSAAALARTTPPRPTTAPPAPTAAPRQPTAVPTMT